MIRRVSVIEEVIYELTPEEVQIAIRSYVNSTPYTDGKGCLGAVYLNNSSFALTSDGGATVMSRYPAESKSASKAHP